MTGTAPSIARIDRRGLLAGVTATLTVGAGGAGAAVPGPLALEARPGGYNGAAPGPLLRVRLGETVAVRLENGLDQPTTLTWHGVRIANAMDGVAGLTQPAVQPGGRFDYRFTPPDAGTFWYHPGPGVAAGAQTRRGLRGLLVVDERDPPGTDADLPLLVADEPGGTALTVNGRPLPEACMVRPGARLRLRLVNGCAERILVVAVTGARTNVIAIDGQPSELFKPAGGTVPIGPGSRFDLVLDVPRAAGAAITAAVKDGGDGAARPVWVAKTAGEARPARPPLAALPANPLLPTRIALERASRHTVAIAPKPGGGWTVNGHAGLPAKPLFSVKRGTPVTLTLRNASDLPQPLHVHGHCWRLLHDLDDGWDPYWRDSVLLAPGRTKHVAFVADNPGRWALVSGDLARQAAGLATWFEVR